MNHWRGRFQVFCESIASDDKIVFCRSHESLVEEKFTWHVPLGQAF